MKWEKIDEKSLGDISWNPDEIKELEELKNKSNKAAENYYTKIHELNENIMNGWTTGDKIRDFVILSCNSLNNKEIETSLNNLEEKLKGNKGKEILVISQKDTIEGCTGFGHEGYIGIDEMKRMAILSDETFYLKIKPDYNSNENLFYSTFDYAIEIPTEKHVFLEERTENWQLVNGSIYLSPVEIQNLVNELRDSIELFGRAYDRMDNLPISGAVQVYTGEDVGLYFKLGYHFKHATTLKGKEKKDYAKEVLELLGKVQSTSEPFYTKTYKQGKKLLIS